MIRAPFAFVLSLMLAACGGGGYQASADPSSATPVAPAVAPPVSLVEAPKAQPPATPVAQPLAPSFDRLLWAEPWERLSVGGWVRREGWQRCASQADSYTGPETAFGIPEGGWAPLGAVNATTSGGRLVIEQLQTGAGWALLSGKAFPIEPLRVTSTVDLQPDPGAWLGLTLHAGEGDYRELATYTGPDGGLWAGIWAPCYWQPLQAIGPGPHALSLEYWPGQGWRYGINGRELATEAADHLGADLLSAPRVGVFVVNLRAEAGGDGWIRATVGPVNVHTTP